MRPLEPVALAVLLVVTVPQVARAQPSPSAAPLARADVAGSIGWLNGRTSDTSYSFEDWFNRGLSGSGVVGWYWTDHHKTEVEAAWDTSGTLHGYDEVRSANSFTYREVRYRITATHLTLTQRYQFGRNAFFHPHVGGGLDLAWETTRGQAESIVIFGPGTGAPVDVERARAIGPDTRLRARFVAEGGFKGYVSERVFFRGDLRLGWRSRLDRALLRFGIGVDF